ncbi:MAG: nitroreductase family protein [Spirochaetes bacterium]|nr:nitroreductase family protein [Spirochaetota bacterium]
MIEFLQKRKSRRFYLDKPVEKEVIEKLVQAALLSPSSRNLHPWDFIIVQDKGMIEKLAASKIHGSSFLKDAPLAVVILGNSDKSDVWIEDSSIAAILIQLEAESLGLGSCWVQIRNRKHSEEETAGDYIRGVMELPMNYHVECVIAVGYSDEKRESASLEELDYSRVHNEKLGIPYREED